MRFRRQNPRPTKRGPYWLMRYRETVDGKVQHKAKRIGLLTEMNRETAARIIKKEIAVIDQRRYRPATVASVERFAEDVYLPAKQRELKASSYKGCRENWRLHWKPRVGRALLCDVRTEDIQRWLDAIAREDLKADGETPLKKETLKRIKSFASGLFSRAKQLGYYDGVNPVVDTRLRKEAEPTGETSVYLLEDVRLMLGVLLEPARTLVATAAFTGLRRGELAAMRWEYWRGTAYEVRGSVWNGKVTTPKTEASGDLIPVIPYLAQLWREHNARCGSPREGWMFASVRNTPACPANVLNREIKPLLYRCAVCGKTESECDAERTQAKEGRVDHEYFRDERVPEWRGWHAFRRGLATNLHDLGVDDKTTQAILRHSSVEVTRKCYIKTLPKQTTDAMEQLNTRLTRFLTSTPAPARLQ